MAAHRKLDLRRVYLCAVGLHKRAALLSYTFKLSSTREGGASHCDRLTIILSLLCGELKRQNPPREALARSLGHVGTSIARAEDFKTITGKEYKDVTVTRVEPDGIILRTKIRN